MMVNSKRVWILAPALLTVAACAAGVQLARERILNPGQLLFNGYANPKVNCYNCHGGDGKGSGRGPNLAARVAKLEDAAILHTIEHGKFLAMPGFDDKTTQQERLQILTWLRETFGGPNTPAPIDIQAEPAPDTAKK